MKSFIIFFCISLCIAEANAQSITAGTISSGGDYFTSSLSKLSFTTGETTSGTYRVGNNVITQGFQQTYYTYWTGKINTAWEDTVNWNGPFPGIHTDIVVLAVPNPLYVSSNAFCRRFFLRPGATVRINTGFKLDLKKE